jgi:hypothetical protein
MKTWPEEELPADFFDIVEPLMEAMKVGYTLRRRIQAKSIPYDGYDLGAREQKHYGSIEDMLSEEGIQAEDKEDRTLLETFLSIAVLLGIEQGRRIEHMQQMRAVVAPQAQPKTLEG